MSDRMTGIRLPGVHGSGFQDYGRKTVPEMLAQIRAYAKHNKEIAEAVLSAADDDFQVTTYLGSLVEKNKEIIQEGRKP